LPGEVNDWWRDRRRMTLVRNGSTWCIEGPGSDRARIAYASLDGDSVTYRVAEPSVAEPSVAEPSVAEPSI